MSKHKVPCGVDVGGDLRFEGVGGLEFLFATQFADENHFEFLSVNVAVEVEDVDFEDALVAPSFKCGATSEVDDSGMSFAV